MKLYLHMTLGKNFANGRNYSFLHSKLTRTRSQQSLPDKQMKVILMVARTSYN